VAFHAIKQDDVITTEVPIHLTGMGESPAERAGLVILQAIEHIQIKAKPAALPEALELSVEGLTTTDDKLSLGDIKLPDGVEFDDIEQNTDLVVANVYEPSALQAANEAAAGEAETDSPEAVEAENGGDTPQDTQEEETRPGGKGQDEPKQANVDANK
jgi:large subunit ribosomal protein L25